VVFRDARTLADLSDQACAAADGLMILRQRVSAADFARFTKLRAVCRMGVGYDIIDRKAAAERRILVCNIPITAPLRLRIMQWRWLWHCGEACCCIMSGSGGPPWRPGGRCSIP
jgi:hypothetical protein